MALKHHFSRRNFLKSGALSSVALAGLGSLNACRINTDNKKSEPFPKFKGFGYKSDDEITGLLFSQIGYEPGFPIHVIIRLPKKEMLTEKVSCVLTPTYQESVYKTECKY